jgi:hypothetical protein
MPLCHCPPAAADTQRDHSRWRQRRNGRNRFGSQSFAKVGIKNPGDITVYYRTTTLRTAYKSNSRASQRQNQLCVPLISPALTAPRCMRYKFHMRMRRKAVVKTIELSEEIIASPGELDFLNPRRPTAEPCADRATTPKPKPKKALAPPAP